eukprot:gb/GECH01000612.1/.p1 GENE.gb/GECH01000612.1/~~gb/GECH01000612.1/.p1  ORF type:complete len:145 (+),score=22.31 gb/GECH01000612.1/:1-435(+)
MAHSPQQGAELYKRNTTMLDYVLSPKKNSVGIFMEKKDSVNMKSAPLSTLESIPVVPVRKVTEEEAEELREEIALLNDTISNQQTEINHLQQENAELRQSLIQQENYSKELLNKQKEELKAQINKIKPRGSSMTRDEINPSGFS